MFEKFNEKARRTIFFARYEASQYGSSYIEVAHLVLGLARESFPTFEMLGIQQAALQKVIGALCAHGTAKPDTAWRR
jgi:ATP-dependent Clp protease ATP-binding subunit ClpC